MKIIHPDGRVTYYYYQKKKGRHKKTGPKKKTKKRGRRWQDSWDFKIIECNFKKQSKYIGKYHNLEEAEAAKRILLEQNENVKFPAKFINNGRNDNAVYERDSEYLILRRITEEYQSNTTQLRNEYGRLVDHQTTSDVWQIYDKFPCLKEESFWVYGYNPKMDRKDYAWICENLIDLYSEDMMVQIYIYNNKVIFRYDSDFNFIVCKNKSDAIRMYNLLSDDYKKNKRVFFTGMVNRYSSRVEDTIDMIQKKTGWSLKKIYITTTRR